MNRRFSHPSQSPLRKRHKSPALGSICQHLEAFRAENKQLKKSNADLEKQATNLRFRLLALMPDPYFLPEDHRTNQLVIQLAFSRPMLASLRNQGFDFPGLCAGEVHRRLQAPLELPPTPQRPTFKFNPPRFWPQSASEQPLQTTANGA